jgi:hypothetical protein
MQNISSNKKLPRSTSASRLLFGHIRVLLVLDTQLCVGLLHLSQLFLLLLLLVLPNLEANTKNEAEDGARHGHDDADKGRRAQLAAARAASASAAVWLRPARFGGLRASALACGCLLACGTLSC